ncbi:MAG: hypothetical protein NWQ82_03585 [Solirubrobacteraceae bacterium]|nr:hypothetical protein [Solirubrobacteraceae bacterium]MDP4673433.1 hypothetical protein [Solirubrobacteraceae bacterium]MDP4921032.1 hypothetical protein [Solirubrobacteraceae bacterium]
MLEFASAPAPSDWLAGAAATTVPNAETAASAQTTATNLGLEIIA